MGRCPARAILKDRKSTAHSSLLKLFAASGEQQRAPTSCSPPPAGAADCATLKVAKARPILWARQQFAASGECNELRRVAVRRVGWRRTARLKEPQAFSLIHRPNSVGFGLSPIPPRRSAPGRQGRQLCDPHEHRIHSPPPFCEVRPRRAPSRAAKASPLPRTAIPLGIALLALAPNSSPKLAPVLRPVSASLRLRYRSAAFSRALGNLVKTRKRILTISLCRRRRADALNN